MSHLLIFLLIHCGENVATPHSIPILALNRDIGKSCNITDIIARQMLVIENIYVNFPRRLRTFQELIIIGLVPMGPEELGFITKIFEGPSL